MGVFARDQRLGDSGATGFGDMHGENAVKLPPLLEAEDMYRGGIYLNMTIPPPYRCFLIR